MNWRESPAFQKGLIGEDIVDKWLISRGWIPYRPVVNRAHPFDRIVASSDKKSIAIVEVKSKPARNNYPDTGINVSHYRNYCDSSRKHNLCVFLAFVDERRKEIYGEFLSVLQKPRTVSGNSYPLEYGGIIYFPLCAMRTIAKLTEEQSNALADLRRSKHDALVVAAE